MTYAVLRHFDSDGRHTAVLNRDRTKIGRSPECDIVLRETLVSRRHAVIARDRNTWTIEDQKSTHGTFLNSVRIEQAKLKSGDVLQFGSLNGSALRFVLEEADSANDRTELNSLNELFSSMQDLQDPAKGDRPAREIEQLSWLIRAARQLNDGLEISDIFRVLLQSTLQLIGVERGLAFLWAQGKLTFVTGLASSGETLEEEQNVSQNAIAKAIKSKSRFSISNTASDAFASGWSSVIVNEIRSIYCIPLRKRGPSEELRPLLGLLYLDSKIESDSLTEIDHQLLDTIANEAAALLENALLAETEHKARKATEELAIAAKIHAGLMSSALPVVPYAELHASSIPCLSIGGDFYDALALDDCVCVTIVDVSGKGVSAAIVAATLQGIIHSQLLSRKELVDIATVLNQFLCTKNVGKYATLVVLKLFSDGRLEYINCGHLSPFVIRGENVRRLGTSNLMVGLIPGAIYESATDRLKAGERILLTTDGITEAENEEGRQFDEVWMSLLTNYRDIEEILDLVATFQAPNTNQDDCTLVELKYIG